MSEKQSLYPITVVREVFTPSDGIVEAVAQVTGTEPRNLKVHGSAFRLIHTPEYDAHVFEVREAERLLTPLGRSALYLSDFAKDQRQGGSERLLFRARKQAQLDEMARALNEIKGIDLARKSTFNLTYVELGKKTSGEESPEREEEIEEILSKMRHPSRARYMYLTRPRIELKHISQYPLPGSAMQPDYY
ncbi:MAG TPA: hypothetical protein VK502_01890 [Candidatus Saccharimonadales bacterium]|nr:hypothetical protein [Candidatus Saccharimonadales bacterium]